MCVARAARSGLFTIRVDGFMEVLDIARGFAQRNLLTIINKRLRFA
jgi:hypothetical protein